MTWVLRTGIGVMLLLVFCLQTTVFAATNSFRVVTVVGGDTEVPTTPVLQTVLPVSPQQVNVVWSASTDNVYMAGYRLFRNGVHIATTTQTNFNDTGLQPETLYAYTVEAFDSSFNISSTSDVVATTTLAVPVIPPATTTPGTTPPGTGTLVTRLESFSVQASERSAFFAWQTNTNTRYTLQWGRTTSYELGSVSTNIFNQAHETNLQNLEPGTHYWYSIISTDGRGISRIAKQGEFVTLPVIQSALPANVRNVEATVEGEDVVLRWQNPALVPGATIRVVRNYLFYPTSITDGALVYEGQGDSLRDVGVLAVHSPEYYTIFVIDPSGMVSSGAVVMVVKAGDMEEQGTSSIALPPQAPLEEGSPLVLKADSVFVRQGVQVQTFASPLVLLFDQNYIVYVPIAAVTTHLKSIIVTVQDPTDQRIRTSYLLKLNQVGDAYEAVVQSPGVSGASRATLEVFDFTQASVRRIVTPVTFVAPDVVQVMFPDDVIWYGRLVMGALVCGSVVLGICFWLLLLFKRRREDKQ